MATSMMKLIKIDREYQYNFDQSSPPVVLRLNITVHKHPMDLYPNVGEQCQKLARDIMCEAPTSPCTWIRIKAMLWVLNITGDCEKKILRYIRDSINHAYYGFDLDDRYSSSPLPRMNFILPIDVVVEEQEMPNPLKAEPEIVLAEGEELWFDMIHWWWLPVLQRVRDCLLSAEELMHELERASSSWIARC